jgi:hypothetical protein
MDHQEIDLAVARLDSLGRKGPQPWSKAKVIVILLFLSG